MPACAQREEDPSRPPLPGAARVIAACAHAARVLPCPDHPRAIEPGRELHASKQLTPPTTSLLQAFGMPSDTTTAATSSRAR